MKEIDDKSFMIILESNEVLGEGFLCDRVAQVEKQIIDSCNQIVKVLHKKK